MKSQKTTKPLGTTKQSQTTSDQNNVANLSKTKERELLAQLKELRLENAKVRRDFFRATQNDALNKGLMEQKNAICAVMLVDQHYNMKKRNKRDNPPGRQIAFTITRDPLSEDHSPTFECTASISIRDLDGERWISDTWRASTKVDAKEKAALDLLYMLHGELDFSMPNGDWIRDLAVEGIEPNPGPVTQNRGRTFRGTNNQTFSLENTLSQEYNTLYISTESANPNQSVSIMIVKGSGAHVLNVGQNKTVGPIVFAGGESVSLTVEQEPPNATVPWRIHQFYGIQRSDPVTIAQTVSTVVTNSVDARILNQPIQTTIVTTQPLDVNVTNATIPISIDGGDGFNVTVVNETPLETRITTDSQPLWVTDINPNIQQVEADSNTDILQSGDVEANPGPGPIDELPDLSNHITTNPYAGMKGRELLPTDIGEPMPYELHDLLPEVWSAKQRDDHFCHLASFNGVVGKYFKVVAHVYDLEVKNRIAMISEEDVEVYKDYEKIGQKPKEQRIPSVPTKVEEPRKERAPKTVKQTEAQIDPEQQKRNVIFRLMAKFTADMEQFICWVDSVDVKRPFKELMANKLFGEGWEKRHSFNVYEAYVYCNLKGVAKTTTQIFIVGLDQKRNCYLTIANHRADLQAAELHNKTMHAYTGNIFTRKMKDVDAVPNWKRLFDTRLRKLNAYTGVEAQVKITNVRGDINPQQSNLFFQDRLRANYLNDNVEVTKNMVLPLPTTNLVPRTHWVEGDADIYTYTTGTIATRTHVAEYYSFPVQPTTYALNLSNNVKAQMSSTWKRDSTLSFGFNVMDVLGEGTTTLQRGLSMEQAALKWEMLHSVLLLKTGSTSIQASSFNIFNTSFVPDTVPGTLDINTGDVLGERCGGIDTPVFPFGGDTGSVAFHLTEATVPKARSANVLYCHPGLLQAGEDGAEAIAYLLAGFTDWPFCMWHLFKHGKYQPLGPNGPTFTTNAKPARFIPTESMTNVPGAKFLDIILPRKVAEPNPGTETAARAMARVVPRFGPTATGPYAANSEIPINCIGGTYRQIPLTNFMVSWATHMDVTSLKQFLGRVGVLIGIKAALNVAKEMRVALCQVAPSMYLANETGVPVPTHPTDNDSLERIIAMSVANHSNHTQCVTPPALEDDVYSYWPIVNNTPVSMRVFETNMDVFNKVILGMVTAENIQAEGLHELPPHIGDPRTPFWDRLEAMPMFIAWAIYYSLTGLTCKGWDTGYTSTVNKWIQQKVKRTFCTEHALGSIAPAPNGGIVRKIMEVITDRSPALAYSSVGETMIEMSHFDRWTPRTSFAKVFGVDRDNINMAPRSYDCFVPVTLPDVMIALFSNKLPKYMMTFPPAWGVDGCCGYSTEMNPALQIHRANSNTIVGTFMAEAKPYYMITEGPDANDDSKWNMKLWFTTPNWIPGNYAGGRLEEQFPYDNNPLILNTSYKPVVRGTALLTGEAAAVLLAPAATYCMPDMSASGERIFMYLSPEDSIIPLQACTRQTKLLRPVWLLGNVDIEPKLQLIGSSSEIVDAMHDLLDKDNEIAFLEAAPAQNVLATVLSVAQQAPIIEDLPNLSNQSPAMSQPSAEID